MNPFFDNIEKRLAKPRKVKYQRPWLYPKQEEAIFYPRDAFGGPARFSCVEASTKTGKTVGCCSWIVEQALLGQRNWNYWWVAPVRGQAEIAYRRVKQMYPPELFDTNESNLILRIPIVGTTIWFKSAEIPDNMFGEDVYAGVFDEASRAREESWHAFRTLLTATRGPARFIGNVKGRHNWFFEMSRKAEMGVKGIAYYKIIAADAVAAGVLSDEEIAEAQRDLPEQVFRELYLAEPSDDGGNPFGLQHIANCVRPLSQKPTVAYGVDLAKSVDWTVLHGLDEDGATSHFDRFQRPWRETLQTIKSTIGMTPTAVDSTGVGDPIVEDLVREIGSAVEGYHFGSLSKQKLMEGLAVDVQQQHVFFPDGIVRKEMETFEFQYNRRNGVSYAAPQGFHDDCVCALALADYKRRQGLGIHVWSKL